DISREKFERFQGLLASLKGVGVFWVTHLSQIDCDDPRFAQVLGFARVIRTDLALDFATCEVDDIERSASLVASVFEKFRGRSGNEPLHPEYEYVISNDAVKIPRWQP